MSTATTQHIQTIRPVRPRVVVERDEVRDRLLACRNNREARLECFGLYRRRQVDAVPHKRRWSKTRRGADFADLGDFYPVG